MSTRIIEYAGIAIGGVLVLGGLVYFVKSPASRHLKPSNLAGTYQTIQENRRGQRTMNNMMSNMRADLNETQNYIPQGTDPTQNIYGGKTKKRKYIKQLINRSIKRHSKRAK
jgi:hypothetical protein